MLVRTPAELGLLLRDRRRKLGLDQRTLAELVGVSRLWLIEFEKGKPRAEIGLVLRTLHALGLELDVSTESEARGASAPNIDAIVDAARKSRETRKRSAR